MNLELLTGLRLSEHLIKQDVCLGLHSRQALSLTVLVFYLKVVQAKFWFYADDFQTKAPNREMKVNNNPFLFRTFNPRMATSKLLLD